MEMWKSFGICPKEGSGGVIGSWVGDKLYRL